VGVNSHSNRGKYFNTLQNPGGMRTEGGREFKSSTKICGKRISALYSEAVKEKQNPGRILKGVVRIGEIQPSGSQDL